MPDNSPMREVKRSAMVAQSPARIYAIINDVNAYPTFLPWCSHARIESASENEVVATIGIKRGLLRMEFTTRNRLVPDHSVHMALDRGPFKELDGLWTLTSIGDQGCRVDLQMRFEFAVVGMASVLEPIFEQTAASLVDAFIARAREIYRQ
jgi:ribosome-associated toxin RatA of RatAB toxin-antitoxin module